MDLTKPYEFYSEAYLTDNQEIYLWGEYLVLWEDKHPKVEITALENHDTQEAILPEELKCPTIHELIAYIQHNGDILGWQQDRDDALADHYYNQWRDN